MSTFRKGLALALLASGACLSAGGFAQDTRKEAEDFYELGREHARKGQLQDAERAFRHSWKLRKTWDTAGNLGLNLIEQGQLKEAAFFLEYCMRNVGSGQKPKQFNVLEQAYSETLSKLGRIYFEVENKPARVYVDGKSTGALTKESPLFVDPGAHQVMVMAEGYEHHKADVVVAAGGQATVAFEWKPLVQVAPIPEKPSQPPTQLPVAKGGLDPLLITGLSITSLATVIGIGFTIGANEDASTAESLKTQLGPVGCAGRESINACQQLQQATGDQESNSNWAIGSFVTAGVAGAATIAWWAIAPKKKEPAIRVNAGFSRSSGWAETTFKF